MRSSTSARAASRSFRRSAIPCRWVCEPAAANSGARATSDWLSSESRDATSRLGRLVLATWLKAAPKRAKNGEGQKTFADRARRRFSFLLRGPAQGRNDRGIALSAGRVERNG